MIHVERAVLAVVSDENPCPAVRLLVDVRPGGADIFSNKFSIFFQYEGDDVVVNAIGVGRCIPFAAVGLHEADAAVPADTAAQLGRVGTCGAGGVWVWCGRVWCGRVGCGRVGRVARVRRPKSEWDVEERKGEGGRVGGSRMRAEGWVGGGKKVREESACAQARGGGVNAGTIRVCEEEAKVVGFRVREW